MNSANKFKKICLLIFAFLMMGIAVKAVEKPYAVYDSNGTLTFKYGEKPSGQFVFDLNNTNYDPEWWALRASVYKVVFESSFSVCAPSSCYRWFYGMTNLSKIEGIEYLRTFNVTNMSQMFRGCSLLTSLDVSGFNTSNVTDMGYMFEDCSGLTSLDVSGFNTSKVTDMQYMFADCSGLTDLDVSGFNTSNCTNMMKMFSDCSSLTSMCYVYGECSELISLDVSGFNTSKVTDMFGMFEGCERLLALDVSGFNTSNVTNMANMFYNCKWLETLDVSGFNTSNVTNMKYMFYHCDCLKSLDLRGFNTSNVTDMQWMFYSSSLNTIYCNDAWTCESSEYMFYSAIGRNLDVTYANPTTGYFTYKAPETRALSINGTTLTDINERDLTKIDGVQGTARYDNPSKTLTLTDAMIFTAADNSSAIQTNLDSLYIVVNA